MKKIMSFILFLSLVFLPSYSFGFGNSSSNSKSKSYSDSDSYSRSSSFGIGFSEAENEGNNTEVHVSENHDYTAVAYPSTASSPDKEERTIGTPFAVFGNNKTEEHIRLDKQLQILNAQCVAGIWEGETTEEGEDYCKSESKRLYKKLNRVNKPGKYLGLFDWNNRNCNVTNACGLLVIK